MKEIQLTDDNILLRENVRKFGRTEVDERPIEYDERVEYELNIDTDGWVPLKNFISVEYTNCDSIKSITLNLEQAEAMIQPNDRTENVEPSQEENSAAEEEIPPVPQVENSKLKNETRERFYDLLTNDNRFSPENLPATVRKIIYQHQDLDREEFDNIIKQKDYQVSGSVQQSLAILDDVTDEVERPNNKIIWIGN
jgi:small-conductance mechanosensitive channel